MSVTRLPGDELKGADNQSLTRARRPLQARSRQRVDRVLDAADALLAERSIDRITVAMIAERADVTRPSIYQFFPSLFAICNELALRYLDELREMVRHDTEAREAPTWRDANARLIDHAVAFYNERPVARVLLLGSGSSQELRVIDRHYDRRFAEAAREVLGDKWPVPAGDGHDPLQVAVVIATSVFSIGVFEEGRIPEFYREQAIRASNGYLASFVEDEVRTEGLKD